MKRRSGVALIALMAGVSVSAQRPEGTAGPSPTPAGLAPDTAKLGDYKKEAGRGVDEMAKLAQEMVDSVFSFGELGFQEVDTSKYLNRILELNVAERWA